MKAKKNPTLFGENLGISAETAKALADAMERMALNAVDWLKMMEETTEYLKQKMKKEAEPAARAVKKQSEKAAKVAMAVGNDLAEKAAVKASKNEVFLQYGDQEIRTEDILDKARADYAAHGHKTKDIKELQVYIKPADNAAYYVINHHDTGKIDF